MATLKSLASDYEKEKKDIKEQYAGYIKSYADQANKQANNSILASDNTYNSAVKNAYIQNMRNARALQQNLQRSGITGGATETSLVNAQNNYLNAVGKLQSDKAAAAASARQNAQDNIAKQTLAYDQDMQNALSTAQANYDTRVNNQRTFDEQKRQYDLNRKDANKQNKIELYSKRAEGYSTVKSVNSAIKKIKGYNEKAKSLAKQAKKYKKGSAKYNSLMAKSEAYKKKYTSNSYKIAVLGSRKNALRVEKIDLKLRKKGK